MKEIKLTREELYNLVWSESLLSLSKKYVISDVGLRKKCKKLEIPLPDLGYWASIQFGKKIPAKKPLKSYSGEQSITLFIREEGDVKKNPEENTLHTLQKEILNDPRVKLKVPERLTNPDPIVESARNDIYKKDVWRDANSIVYVSHGHLSIQVAPGNVSRALRIMDTFIKAIRARGHTLISKNGEIYIVAYGEEIQISCREKHQREVVKGTHWDSTILKPTGKLAIRIDYSYNLKEWVDGKTLLEDQLHIVIAGVEMRALKERGERIERERQWAIQQEQERIAKELQDRKDKELKDFKEIFRLAKRHEQSNVIRRYADELEKTAITRNDLTDATKQKIDWIRKKADWYDPFVESYDELLQEVDKEELTFKKQTWSWG